MQKNLILLHAAPTPFKFRMFFIRWKPPPPLHHNRLSLERLRPLCTFLRLFLIS
jgi:hypothetical protein